MKNMEQVERYIQNVKKVAYKNAAINAKVSIGAKQFYSQAMETIRYYRKANSHKVTTIQAYCNMMGYSI